MLIQDTSNRTINLSPFPSDVDIEIRDGTIAFAIPAVMNTLELTTVLASVYVPGTGSGTTNIKIRRSRVGDDQDMLSTILTLSTGQYFIADGIVDESYDDVLTGDLIYVDVTQLTTTPPQGLSVVLTFG